MNHPYRTAASRPDYSPRRSHALRVLTLLVFVTGVGVGARSISGCFGAGSIQPTADLGVCIATKALAGESISQIANDCKTDVEQVILSLLGSSDPKVGATPAHAESLRIMRMHGPSGDGGVE